MIPGQKAIIAQLLAHRDTLAAALAQTDATLVTLGVDLETGGPAECEHLDVTLAPGSTLGAVQYVCATCHQTFDAHPHAQE